MKLWQEIKEAYQGQVGLVLVPLTVLFAIGLSVIIIAILFGYWPTH